MKKEFNLSVKRIMYDNDGAYCFAEEDVKEFIRLLKEELIIANNRLGHIENFTIVRIIEHLAGDKLIEDLKK
jgi:hypothetical protein